MLTNYGEIYTLFWDIPPSIEDRSINKLVRKLQPGIFINNRGYDEGDFSTPERELDDVSGVKRFENMTEACNAVGEQSWGYREKEDYHSIRYITCYIYHIMSMGGNYLLNVGPMADGTIDEKAKSIIERVGRWYNNMEGSLENVKADDFDYQVMVHKCVVNKKDNKSYFNFYECIYSSAVSLKKYPGLPKNVRLLNTGDCNRFTAGLL